MTSVDQIYREHIDQVYRERNAIACALANAVLVAGGVAGVTTDPNGEPGFRLVVVVHLPAGRVGWHMDERDPHRPWLALPYFPEPWESFADAENRSRLLNFCWHPTPELAPSSAPA